MFDHSLLNKFKLKIFMSFTLVTGRNDLNLLLLTKNLHDNHSEFFTTFGEFYRQIEIYIYININLNFLEQPFILFSYGDFQVKVKCRIKERYGIKWFSGILNVSAAPNFLGMSGSSVSLLSSSMSR